MIKGPATPVTAADRVTRSCALHWLPMLVTMLAVSVLVMRPYYHVWSPKYGWTRMIAFGAHFGDDALPRLKRIRHFVDPDPGAAFGYDGQFYAQMAIDPSLRDPAFEHAMDGPLYRARRIGLPALAYVVGVGKPRWILQVYSVANLAFWMVLAGALLPMLKPWSWQQLFCLAGGLLCNGVTASMQFSLTDLPAAALMMVGLAFGSWGGYRALAAATLTRETSALAALAWLDFRRPWLEPARLWRNVGKLALVFIPLVIWLAYVSHRFGGAIQEAAGAKNFGLPLVAMFDVFASNFKLLQENGPGVFARQAGPLGWFYNDSYCHEMLVITALFFQGLYIALRTDLSSPVWRTGAVFLVLGIFLGPAPWGTTSAAARALLPMTVCFYLLLARERIGCFALFFALGSISIPTGVYEFWNMR